MCHVGIQFPLYEHLKTRLSHDQKPNLTNIIISSSISKMIASTVAYPHEVLRTRLQDQGHGDRSFTNSNHSLKYPSLLQLIKTTWKEENIFGFYKGLSTNLIRVVPAAAITLSSFEYLIDFFHK